jgi:hypothetical protein
MLVDTGADSSLLAPADTLALHLDTSRLPPDVPSLGIGGLTSAVRAPAAITLGAHIFTVALRVLVPSTSAQQQMLGYIPSLLGRDLLAHFALVFEERTGRVLLLEPHEADALALP